MANRFNVNKVIDIHSAISGGKYAYAGEAYNFSISFMDGYGLDTIEVTINNKVIDIENVGMQYSIAAEDVVGHISIEIVSRGTSKGVDSSKDTFIDKFNSYVNIEGGSEVWGRMNEAYALYLLEVYDNVLDKMGYDLGVRDDELSKDIIRLYGKNVGFEFDGLDDIFSIKDLLRYYKRVYSSGTMGELEGLIRDNLAHLRDFIVRGIEDDIDKGVIKDGSAEMSRYLRVLYSLKRDSALRLYIDTHILEGGKYSPDWVVASVVINMISLYDDTDIQRYIDEYIMLLGISQDVNYSNRLGAILARGVEVLDSRGNILRSVLAANQRLRVVFPFTFGDIVVNSRALESYGGVGSWWSGEWFLGWDGVWDVDGDKVSYDKLFGQNGDLFTSFKGLDVITQISQSLIAYCGLYNVDNKGNMVTPLQIKHKLDGGVISQDYGCFLSYRSHKYSLYKPSGERGSISGYFINDGVGIVRTDNTAILSNSIIYSKFKDVVGVQQLFNKEGVVVEGDKAIGVVIGRGLNDVFGVEDGKYKRNEGMMLVFDEDSVLQLSRFMRVSEGVVGVGDEGLLYNEGDYDINYYEDSLKGIGRPVVSEFDGGVSSGSRIGGSSSK